MSPALADGFFTTEPPGKLNRMGTWWNEGPFPCEELHFYTCRHVLWRRKWQPTPVFLPGESLVGCRLWGCTESDTTEVMQQQQQHVLKGKVAPRGKKGKSPMQLQHFFFFHRRNPLCTSVTTAKPRQLDMKILPLLFSKTSLMTVPKMITPQSW